MSRRVINLKLPVTHRFGDEATTDELHAGTCKMVVVDGGYEVRFRSRPNQVVFIPRELAMATFEETKKS